MPTYEYLCQTCHHRFETWQRMVDEPLTVCPECGGAIHRVLYPAGVIFKGSGFYKTDHHSKSDSAPASTTSKDNSESATESKSTGTAESPKPAASESTAARPSAS
ncbi:FmdB family zinc ribbon protein [Ktedonospora formicarum]|uniref:FmdB family zinc ribbon protein n=1 Tax=Ktedonospora formicarum TaxID=2778364 RepID=UPI001C690BDD|nr:FmdB family zinc ribbon protein [Ktedonospora formicarum]